MPGLANPLGLLALASIGVLIALTLLARRTRVTPVASLLLWKRIEAPPVERQRFRPDLLFVLRLLLLLALAAGYAGPYLAGARGGAPGGLAVVLDTSASMQVREADGQRFDAARRRLDALIAALPVDSPVLLVAAADRPRIVLRWSTDRTRLAERLAALEPLDTPTALPPAVRLALSEAARRPGARVVVLTDLPPAAGGLPPAELAAVDWTAFGRRGDNVALTALTVSAPPFAAPADVRVDVVVRNFGPTGRSLALEVSVDDTPWVRHAVALPARGSRRVALGAPPRAGLLRVELSGDDALAVDDRATAWIPSQPVLDVLAVTESDAFAGTIRALVATARGHVEVVNRAGLSERASVAAGAGVVTVFDRGAPTADHGAGSVLHVAPPPGNAICPSARMLDDASVIDWDATHPVLAGLHGFEAVEAARAAQLALPDWGVPVMTAASRRAAYPFLIVGEARGRRRACLAAELPAGPVTSDAMPLALLVLGTLRWLAEPVVDEPIMLSTGVPRQVAGPVGGGEAGLRAAGDPPVVLAERAGVHRLDRNGGPARLVLANLLDDTESDVGRDGDGTWPAVAAPAGDGTTPARSDLSWWLYLAAGALLVVEWIAWGLAG